MPGLMLHLLIANKVTTNGSPLYHLGNIAPDAVADWHNKDITHFRNLDDRQPALISLAQNTFGDFAEGVLLHLYFDWKWDTVVRQKFIDKIGDDWFIPYRNELSFADSYAFHHTEWAKRVWRDMDMLNVNVFGATPGASSSEVKDFVSRNNNWYNENIKGPSSAFTPNLIESFTTDIATEYVIWREQI